MTSWLCASAVWDSEFGSIRNAASVSLAVQAAVGQQSQPQFQIAGEAPLLAAGPAADRVVVVAAEHRTGRLPDGVDAGAGVAHCHGPAGMLAEQVPKAGAGAEYPIVLVDEGAPAGDQAHLRAVAQDGGLAGQRTGQQQVVVAEHLDELAGAGLDDPTEVLRQRHRLGVAQDPHPRVVDVGEDLRGAVAAGVVEDDHLEVHALLGERRVESGTQMGLALVRRYANRNPHRPSPQQTRLSHRRRATAPDGHDRATACALSGPVGLASRATPVPRRWGAGRRAIVTFVRSSGKRPASPRHRPCSNRALGISRGARWGHRWRTHPRRQPSTAIRPRDRTARHPTG